MENLAHLVIWQNKIFQTGTSLISTGKIRCERINILPGRKGRQIFIRD